MAKPDPGAWLAALAEPLASDFGERLTVRRDGHAVLWCCDGRSALVELRPDGELDATFVDRPSVERVATALAAPLYRSSGRGYGLNAEGCRRMANDLTDFFCGVREPRFRFVGTSSLESYRSKAKA